MRLMVTPGVSMRRVDHSIVTTSARGAQGLYLGGTLAQAHVALERVGLVIVDSRHITPMTSPAPDAGLKWHDG
jgi:hypothetical protein